MTTKSADYCMLINEWAWSNSRVCLLRLGVDFGSVLESEIKQNWKYGAVYTKSSLKWKKFRV